MQFRYNPDQRNRDARALAALDEQMPGALRFYQKRNRFAWAAFLLRCGVVLYTAVMYIVLMGDYTRAASTLLGLVVAGLLCILISRGNWVWSLFLLLWGVMGLRDSIPILTSASNYVLSFVGLAALECAVSLVWLVLFVLLLTGGGLRFAPAVAQALKNGVAEPAAAPAKEPQPEPRPEPAQVESIEPVGRPYPAGSAEGRISLLTARWNGHALVLDHCAAETRLVVDGFVRCLLPGTRRTQGFCLCAELDGVLLRGIVLPRPGGYAAALYAGNDQLARATRP
ncbi:hypothetical protein WMO24_08560 [Ruthenibacterium sp. CLA-JM-H11]|uniref:DUF4131 domain-containing protein n=1 Tax=Ruthenibacterium intestinale TaxID=3133163 RepID=A0ABV1GF59_9FIRM